MIYSFLIGLLFTGCLDESPEYTVNSKVVYESEISAQMALTGIYGLMATQGGFAQLLPEINTEASGLCWTSFNTSDNRCQYTNGLIPVANEFNDLVWTAMYKAIANCNIFIEGCETGGTWASKGNMIAQAKFMRAVCYYNLLSFYGGVPLRLSPPSKESIQMPRASRQEVINQIEKDWIEAASGLNEGSVQGNGVPTAPGKYAAYAYLAKLYWIQGSNAWAFEQGDEWATTVLKREWPEMRPSREYFTIAKHYGDSVLSKGNFSLEPDFNTLFNGKRVTFSKEFVFVINTTGNTTENVGYNSLHWTFSPQNCSPGETWGRSQPNKSFFDWAQGTYKDDARLKTTFTSSWVKYVNKVPSKDTVYSYPIVTKVMNDTVWKDTVIRDKPVKIPVITQVTRIVDYIRYELYDDPCNPQFDPVRDSLLIKAFAQTKGGNDWNINDWPYFGKYMTNDCSGRYANNNLYVYRYADFLLLMADVENELGNTAKAVELGNQVLQRARNSSKPVSGYPRDWDAVSQDELREKIFHERLFELAAEYDMFNDTRRRGISWRRKLLERNNSHHTTKACYEYGLKNNYTSQWREYWYPNDGKEDWTEFLKRNQLLPIPQKESSTNDLITTTDQNYGY